VIVLVVVLAVVAGVVATYVVEARNRSRVERWAKDASQSGASPTDLDAPHTSPAGTVAVERANWESRGGWDTGGGSGGLS
jgi:hypothetical protein